MTSEKRRLRPQDMRWNCDPAARVPVSRTNIRNVVRHLDHRFARTSPDPARKVMLSKLDAKRRQYAEQEPGSRGARGSRGGQRARQDQPESCCRGDPEEPGDRNVVRRHWHGSKSSRGNQYSARDRQRRQRQPWNKPDSIDVRRSPQPAADNRPERDPGNPGPEEQSGIVTRLDRHTEERHQEAEELERVGEDVSPLGSRARSRPEISQVERAEDHSAGRPAQRRSHSGRCLRGGKPERGYSKDPGEQASTHREGCGGRTEGRQREPPPAEWRCSKQHQAERRTEHHAVPHQSHAPEQVDVGT